MLSNLLTVALANAKLVLAAGVGAALVAGGGAVAISTVSADVAPDPIVTEQVVTEDAAKTVDQSATTSGDADSGVTQVVTSPSDTGTAGIKPDNHGQCVSAVARDKKPGESGRDHGKRVSAAAKSCPKGDKDGEDSDDTNEAEAEDADDAAKAERKATKRAEKAERKQVKRAEKAERKQVKHDSDETDD